MTNLFKISELFNSEQKIKNRLALMWNNWLLFNNYKIEQDYLTSFYELIKISAIEGFSIFDYHDTGLMDDEQITKFCTYLFESFQTFYTQMKMNQAIDLNNLFDKFAQNTAIAKNKNSVENKTFDVNNIREENLIKNEAVYLSNRSTTTVTNDINNSNSQSLATILPSTYPFVEFISKYMTNSVYSFLVKITYPVGPIPKKHFPWMLRF